MLGEYEVRLQKLEKIIALGWQPYPAQTPRTHTLGGCVSLFETLQQENVSITLAGRIISIRTQGAITFATLKDESGEMQIFLKKDSVGEEMYTHFVELIDRGDFVAATGTLFVTKRGEKSLAVERYTLLSKTLNPLPEKWHGVADVEIRYRKRYLDLLANEEVYARFLVRSKIVHFMRDFLHKEGYVEVETPVLQPLYGGTSARPFITHHNTLDIDLYLRISAELYLKRLVVGGMEKVFEISRIFRNEGVSFKHNPEFTMLETMAAYEDYTYNMSLIERTYEYCAQQIFGTTKIKHGEHELEFKAPWRRAKMVDIVKEVTGWDYYALRDAGFPAAKNATAELGLGNEPGFHNAGSVGELLALVFEEKIESMLIQPTIVYEYPVETSPLAKQCAHDPNFVERFEHYAMGQEQGNNYSELNDPIELRKRFDAEAQKEKQGKGLDEIQKTDEDFIEAIGHGMPPTSGAAIGIDRMVMLFTGADSIKEVILFPTMRPKE